MKSQTTPAHKPPKRNHHHHLTLILTLIRGFLSRGVLFGHCEYEWKEKEGREEGDSMGAMKREDVAYSLLTLHNVNPMILRRL